MLQRLAHQLRNLDPPLARSALRPLQEISLREIRTLPILHDILAAHEARPAAGSPDVLAFATGNRRDRSNLRERVLAEVFERADRADASPSPLLNLVVARPR